jgi:short-subunit dehydrogenase
MHVVVTGASSGIGEAIAREYLARGASVTLVARRRDLLEKIAASAPSGKTNVLVRDLGEKTLEHPWLDEAEAALGPIDVFVNNAGVQIVKPAVEVTWEEAERLLHLDLLVPLRLNQLVLKRMIARGTEGARAIVDVSSMAAIGPTPGMYFYNAAKGGLAAASEGLRAEVKRYGIHVVTVYPGPVTSAMEAAGRAAYEEAFGSRNAPTGSPEVLARLVCDAVEKKKPRVVYPSVYGLARHFPNATRWFVDAFTPKLRSASEASSASASDASAKSE